jgi:hypothetical protein
MQHMEDSTIQRAVANFETGPGRVYGKKPNGTSTGDEHWVQTAFDDGTVIVTMYAGWLITDVVRLSGANAGQLTTMIIRNLLDAPKG